jgi:hypothetical protein
MARSVEREGGTVNPEHSVVVTREALGAEKGNILQMRRYGLRYNQMAAPGEKGPSSQLASVIQAGLGNGKVRDSVEMKVASS